MRLLILILAFSLNLLVFAKPIGFVRKIKGSVTVLAPHAKEAKKLSKGDKVLKDSSILTEKRSFVSVKLYSGSSINVGPNSKIVLDVKPKTTKSVVNLLRGKMRAIVEKNKREHGKEEVKLYIKTKSAAMGVRGTTFEVLHNTENSLTALITLEGEVLINKLDQALSKTIYDIDKSLELKSVGVKLGEYSGVSENLPLATRPVRISPLQLAAVKLQEDLGTSDKKPTKEQIKSTAKAIQIQYSNNAPSVSDKGGTFSPKSGSYTPRPGGYVDLSSGIYIPPKKDASYNEKTKVYKMDGDRGRITLKGTYKPPKGLILESDGFVPADENGTEVSLKVKNLNKAISGQIVKPAKEEKGDLEIDIDDAYEKYFNVK